MMQSNGSSTKQLSTLTVSKAVSLRKRGSPHHPSQNALHINESNLLMFNKRNQRHFFPNPTTSEFSPTVKLSGLRFVKVFTIFIGSFYALVLLSELHLDQFLFSAYESLIFREEHIFPRIAFVEYQTLSPYLRVALQHQNATKTTRPMNRKSHALRYPMVSASFTKHLEHSRDYRAQSEPQETEDCEPQYSWQTESRPACNKLHEIDMTHIYHDNNVISSRLKLIANGYWADIWAYVEDDVQQSKYVIKMLRFVHDINGRNIDRNRRDSMAMEHLTSAKYVVNTYGYCSISGIVEFSDGGTLGSAIWPGDGGEPLTNVQKLRLATQATMGLSAVHNADEAGKASIVHSDIQVGQFLFFSGQLKLNDFNRARFLLKYKQNGTNCPFFVGNNPGKWRSPEEYNYEPQTEKVDVYSLGNVFYSLLQEDYPFRDVSYSDTTKLVLNGTRPTMYYDIWDSTDPCIQAIKHVMMMCHHQLPSERPSARQVEHFLKEAMRKLDPGTLEQWGDA